MNKDLIKQAYRDSLLEALEGAAFVFAEEHEEEKDEWTGEIVRAMLSFTGSINGAFAVFAPSDLCAKIASDMLGEPETIPRNEEILGEILNMTAGLALEKLVGNQGEWTLSVPEISRIRAKDYVKDDKADFVLRFLTEDEEIIEAAYYRDYGEMNE